MARDEGQAEFRCSDVGLDGRAGPVDTELVSVLDRLPTAVFLLDVQGHPCYANQAAKRLLGRGADPDIGTADLALLYDAYVSGTDDLYPASRMPVVRALAGETVTVDDMELRSPGKPATPIQVWAAPITDEDGAIRFAAAVFKDLSRPRAEQDSVAPTHESKSTNQDIDFVETIVSILGTAIERTQRDTDRDRLHHQERMAQVGHIAAGVAHDLSSTMGAISRYASMLRAQPLDEAGRAQLAAIEDQIEQGIAVVWQVLELAHRNPLERRELDLVTFIDELVPAIRRTLPEEIDLAVVHDPGPYPVDIDRVRLQQAVMNLTSNARDAIHGPGHIRIALSRLDETALLQVIDDGAGMTPEVLARAFEPFFTTKPAGSGTGLGLLHARGTIFQHGGSIDIDSSESGTCVNVKIPMGTASV